MTMTYNGSTAGSTAANPPVLLAAAIGGHVQFVTSGSSVSTGVFNGLPDKASGAKLWFYSSTNIFSDVFGAATFNDGVALGMTIGDVLIGVQTSANSTTPFCYMGVLVTSIGSTSFMMSTAAISSTAV